MRRCPSQTLKNEQNYKFSVNFKKDHRGNALYTLLCGVIIMREPNYKVQGFLQEKRERQKQVVNARNLEGTFRGYKLDEIELQATIKNQKELDELIMFLQESRPCFG